MERQPTFMGVHMCAKLLQSCPILCDTMDCSPARLLCPGFSRKEYWSGLPCPLPGDFLNPGIKPASLTSPALVSRFSTTSTLWEAPYTRNQINVLGTVCSWSWRLTFESLPHNGLLPKSVWSGGEGPGSPRVGGHCSLPGIWSLK